MSQSDRISFQTVARALLLCRWAPFIPIMLYASRLIDFSFLLSTFSEKAWTIQSGFVVSSNNGEVVAFLGY